MKQTMISFTTVLAYTVSMLSMFMYLLFVATMNNTEFNIMQQVQRVYMQQPQDCESAYADSEGMRQICVSHSQIIDEQKSSKQRLSLVQSMKRDVSIFSAGTNLWVNPFYYNHEGLIKNLQLQSEIMKIDVDIWVADKAVADKGKAAIQKGFEQRLEDVNEKRSDVKWMLILAALNLAFALMCQFSRIRSCRPR